jgi:Protein of unknown function (DUF642)
MPRIRITSTLDVPCLSTTIVNGRFELPILPDQGYQQFFGGSNIDGWTVVGNDVLLIQKAIGEPYNGIPAFTPQSGFNTLDLTGSGNAGSTNGVEQQIKTNIGETYRLSFFVGVILGNIHYSLPSTLDISIDRGARISFTNANLVQGTVTWQQFFWDFTATSLATSIAFLNGTPSEYNNFVGLDNVRIVAIGKSSILIDRYLNIELDLLG